MGRSSDPSTYVPTNDHSSDPPYHSSHSQKRESARKKRQETRGQSGTRRFAFGCLIGMFVMFLLLAPDSNFSKNARDLFYVMQHSIVDVFDALSR